MKAISTLLGLSPLIHSQHFSYIQQRHNHPNLVVCFTHQRKPNLSGLRIAVKYKQSDEDVRPEPDHNDHVWKNSFDQIIVQIKEEALDSLKNVLAVLLGLLFFYDSNCALAASGGRIGGSSFSSRSRSSSSSSSSSISYSKSSSSSSSSSYSKPRSSSSSSTSTSYPKPRSSSSRSCFSYCPSISSSSCTSYAKPRSYSSSSSRSWWPSTSSSSTSIHYSVSEPSLAPKHGGGFDGGQFLMGIVAAVVVAVLIKTLSPKSEDDIRKISVIKLQVGLLGSGRTLQRDFNRLAESADTSTPEGLAYVLTEATLAMLRHPDYCISSYASVDMKRSMEDGEELFNQLSVEERGKFDEETLVNVNSIKRRNSEIQRATGFNNEYIVVTILVAAEGVHKLLPINRSADLKKALQKLGSIPRKNIMAVEILWTPQEEKDVLSERELLEDYPLLRPL